MKESFLKVFKENYDYIKKNHKPKKVITTERIPERLSYNKKDILEKTLYKLCMIYDTSKYDSENIIYFKNVNVLFERNKSKIIEGKAKSKILNGNLLTLNFPKEIKEQILNHDYKLFPKMYRFSDLLKIEIFMGTFYFIKNRLINETLKETYKMIFDLSSKNYDHFSLTKNKFILYNSKEVYYINLKKNIFDKITSYAEAGEFKVFFDYYFHDFKITNTFSNDVYIIKNDKITKVDNHRELKEYSLGDYLYDSKDFCIFNLKKIKGYYLIALKKKKYIVQKSFLQKILTKSICDVKISTLKKKLLNNLESLQKENDYNLLFLEL